MQFTLTFKTDNAAFVEDVECQIIEILDHCANEIGDGQRSGNVRDEHGNTIGQFELIENT